MSEQERHDEDFLDWLSEVATDEPQGLPMELEYELVELTRRANRTPSIPWTPALVLALIATVVVGLAAPGVWNGVAFLALIVVGVVYAAGIRVVLREHSGGISGLQPDMTG